MGSFNMPCVVSKTPIHSGDECVVVVFDTKSKKGNLDFRGWAESGDGQERLLQNYLVGAFHGKYCDYGEIDNPSCPKMNFDKDNRILTYFVSKEVWDFIDQKYKDYTPHWVEADLAILEIMRLVENEGRVSSFERTEYGERAKKAGKFKDEYRIIYGMMLFCQQNNFFPFTFTFSDFYASQEWNLAAAKEFQELRRTRIDKKESFKKGDNE